MTNVITQLAQKNLKLTPQRLAVYKALISLDHPYVDEIVAHVRRHNPTISVATVYNVLEVLEQNELISKLASYSGKTRYDSIMKKHFHVYNQTNDTIYDFEDSKLSVYLQDYFKNNPVGNKSIKDIKLQLNQQ